MVLLFFFKDQIPNFRFSLSLLLYFIEKIFLTSAPGRSVAAEEFCVFGDWGGSLNKPEKPERRRGFLANGAPLALLAKFAFRNNFSQFVRQNAPACHITFIDRFFLIEKIPSDFGLFEPSCHITYMRGFLENSPDKNETKTPLVSYQYYEEKNF